MSSPTILTYASCADGADLTVHADTDLIIGVFMASTPSPTLEGVALTAIQNSTNVSIYKYESPATGALTLGGGTAGFFYCIQNGVNGESQSGKRTGNGLITLTTVVGDLCIAAMDTSGIDPGQHFIREDDITPTSFTYSTRAGDDTIGYRIATDVSMGAYFREEEVGKVVSGAVLIVVPYNTPSPTGPVGVKKVSGVAVASIKKISGVALADIKKVSGVG